MATLTRSTSRTTPTYKEYVNFLGAYKSNGKKENPENSDVTDFSKSSCVSYNTFLENSKNKKFDPVRANPEEKTTKKSEIFIEIQPPKTVSEVSKIFEHRDTEKTAPKKINSKIDIFEKQISTEKPKLNNYQKQISAENRPKISEKPILPKSPPPKVEMEVKSPPSPPRPDNIVANGNIPPPPPSPPQAPSVTKMTQSGANLPPPPPPMVSSSKVRATLIKGPQIKHTVNNPNGTLPAEIDRNDPMVKKLVYGTLRGLYGAYHDKANDMMATLPKNRVTKSNGVQDIIEKIASNGDLEKLNGRINPKLEQD